MIGLTIFAGLLVAIVAIWLLAEARVDPAGVAHPKVPSPLPGRH